MRGCLFTLFAGLGMAALAIWGPGPYVSAPALVVLVAVLAVLVALAWAGLWIAGRRR